MQQLFCFKDLVVHRICRIGISADTNLIKQLWFIYLCLFWHFCLYLIWYETDGKQGGKEGNATKVAKAGGQYDAISTLSQATTMPCVNYGCSVFCGNSTQILV